MSWREDTFLKDNSSIEREKGHLTVSNIEMLILYFVFHFYKGPFEVNVVTMATSEWRANIRVRLETLQSNR